MGIVGVGFIVGVIALLLLGVNRTAATIGSKSWPTVEGEIIASAYRSLDDDVQFRYRYSVKGISREQTSMFLGGRWYPGRGESRPQYFKRVLKDYPVGQRVAVHYNPEAPDQTYLLFDNMASGLMPLIFAVFLFIIGIMVAGLS
jgi:hypothetical protein